MRGKRVDLPFYGCGHMEGYTRDEIRSCQGPAVAMVVLTQGQSELFYHFFAEIISRVMWVHEQYPELIRSPKTLYHTTCLTQECNDIARLVGIKTKFGFSSHLVKGCWRARLAAWPPSSTACGEPRAAALQRMNRHLCAAMTRLDVLPAPQAARRPVAVLIRRKAEPDKRKVARVIENHEEVRGAVEAAGWDVVVHDAESLQDVQGQCAMFYAAELIVGPHGAGLANMLCARLGAVVIEIKQSDAGYNKSFKNLAADLGLRYVPLDTKAPFSLPFYGSGCVNASAVGEAAAEALRSRGPLRCTADGDG